MRIMDLNVKEGQVITLIANGVDEKDATNALKEFLLGYQIDQGKMKRLSRNSTYFGRLT